MILIVLAALALSAAEEPPPPPEVAAAASAWSQCIQDGLDRSDMEQSPRSAARQIAASCQPSAETMLAAHRRWVEASSLSEREKRDGIRGAERSVSSPPPVIATGARGDR